MTDRFMTRVAVFIIIRNDKGEVLLQQRGPASYLGGYWDSRADTVNPGNRSGKRRFVS